MTLKEIMSNFMDCSSLNALPFIVNAETKLIKLLWMIILGAGTAAMIFHLSYVLMTYLKYETTTAISFTSSNLTFPDVYICTKNTVRKSKIDELEHKEFEDFLEQFVNANVSSGIPIQSLINVTNPFGSDKTTWSQNVHSLERILYGAEKREVRREVGHQLKDMLLTCEFGGETCSESDFVLENTMDYGNCFFFNPKDRTVNTPGSEHGLHIELFLEGNEFIPYLSQFGLQVLISPPNAMKFPSDLGIYASSNFDTRIAIKQNKITRLDGNYGPCNSSDTTLGGRVEKIYTKYACNVLCEIDYAEDVCGCVVPQDMDYAILQKKETDISVCNISATECVESAKESLRNESVSDCSDLCGNSCNETTYSLTLSTQIWPDFYASESLVNYVCRENSTGCSYLRGLDYFRKRDNFAALTIFYQEMQYTLYAEDESYGLVSFTSDFGGTMGLWIGISAITAVEIIYLFCRLVKLSLQWMCCSSKSKSVNVELNKY